MGVRQVQIIIRRRTGGRGTAARRRPGAGGELGHRPRALPDEGFFRPRAFGFVSLPRLLFCERSFANILSLSKRAPKMLQSAYLIAKIGFDTAEKELAKNRQMLQNIAKFCKMLNTFWAAAKIPACGPCRAGATTTNNSCSRDEASWISVNGRLLQLLPFF